MDVNEPRELTIRSQRREPEELMVSVSDAGVGLPTTLPAAQPFTLPFPPRSRPTTDTYSRLRRARAGDIGLIPKYDCLLPNV
jgi:hypothetical protein